MGLKLNGSSSGSVELNAPASTTSGADVVLTLPVNDGDADQVLTTNGSGALTWATPTATTRYARSGGVNLTNQSTVEFTGIPSWAEFFVVTFRGVSTSTTNDVQIQVGDADAYITTGYQSNSGNNAGSAIQGRTNSFFFDNIANGEVMSGRMVFQRDSDSNGLVMNGSVTAGTGGGMKFATGHVVHTGLVVTRVRLTIASGNYDSGVINLYYQG
jgi:hypothetical protein